MQNFKIGERVQHNGGEYDSASIKEFDSGTIVNLHYDGVICLVRWDNPEKSAWSEWWIRSDSLSYI